MNNTMSPAHKQLLNFISKFESKRNYNVVSFKYKGKLEKPLTEMTLFEVFALQEKMKPSGSTAVGAYQFMGPTLKEVTKQMALSSNEKFTPELQDKMIIFRLEKLRGLDKFLKGEMTLPDFALNLAKEFASMPSPITGKSFYDKDGVNKNLVDIDTYLNQLSSIRTMV